MVVRMTGMAVLGLSLAICPGLSEANSGKAKKKERCVVPDDALLPDLWTVVPKHLQLHNKQKREILRFTNGIANLGPGLWFLEPLFPGEYSEDEIQSANQVFASDTTVVDEVPLASGPNVVGKCVKGEYAFHPTHNHWHMSDVAEYRLCSEESFDQAYAAGEPAGCEPVGKVGTKVTFCLIDSYKLADNTNSSDETRNFWDCETAFQGVSPGWVDQYHQSLDDQDLTITGLEPGNYVLVTTSNHNALYEELALDNNTSWTRFVFSRESNGNPKLEVYANSCDDLSYRGPLESRVSAFAGGDAEYAQRLVDDMCGGASTNR